MATTSTIDYKVSGSYLRAWLAGLRRISGLHYPFLLEKCGLSQFEKKYPVANFEIVASEYEISRLSQIVYDFLGPNAFNLFMINLGREFGRTASTLPVIKHQAENLEPVTNLPGLIKLLELMIAHNRSSVNEHIILKMTDKPNVLELIYPNCIYCADLPPMQRPACPGIGAFWGQFVYEFTGRRLRIEEVRCGAVHREADCHFLIYY